MTSREEARYLSVKATLETPRVLSGLEPFKVDGKYPEKLSKKDLVILGIKDQKYYTRWADEKNKELEEEVEKSKEIKFNYESEKPKKEIRTLEELKAVLIKYFPNIWKEVKASLSTICALSLKYLNGCLVLVLVGNPSGEKTTTTSLLYGHNKTYLSDDWTAKSFVTHAVNVKGLDLEEIDLLPKIKNKMLIVPELAPLFEAPKDNLLDNFRILTRVLDGEGLNRDSGVHGHRGYSGDFIFTMLGATTPLRAAVWNLMGKMGNRMFFYSMNNKNSSDEELMEMFTEEEYQEKIKICRGAVHSFLTNYFKKNPIRSIEWDNKKDILILKEIIKYAKLLSKARGTLMTWKGDERGEYEYSFPIIEEPPRAINCLRNFARGHALINGRIALTEEDLEIVRHICFSSMPHDRFKFLELLRKYEGTLTTEILKEELKCSQDTALRTMKIFEVLGVVTLENLPMGSAGHPVKYVRITEEFKELISNTQGVNNAINLKSQENRGVCNPYDSVKMEDYT